MYRSIARGSIRWEGALANLPGRNSAIRMKSELQDVSLVAGIAGIAGYRVP